VTVTMIVPQDSPVGVEIVGIFMLMLPVIQIAATISQGLGLAMTEATASLAEDAQRGKEIVIVTMTVHLDLPVVKTTVKSFIPTLIGVWIAATISQGLGLEMTEATATLAGDAQRGKEIVIVTMTVRPDLPVGKTTVKSFIPMLIGLWIAATISQGLEHMMITLTASLAEDA